MHPLDKILPDEWLIAVAVRIETRDAMEVVVKKFKEQHGVSPDLLLVSRNEGMKLVTFDRAVPYPYGMPEKTIVIEHKVLNMMGLDLWVTTLMDEQGGAYLIARKAAV